MDATERAKVENPAPNPETAHEQEEDETRGFAFGSDYGRERGTGITKAVMDGYEAEVTDRAAGDVPRGGMAASGGNMQGNLSGPTGEQGYTGGVGMPNEALDQPAQETGNSDKEAGTNR